MRGLGTPLPCRAGSRNVAGGTGAGDKTAKVLPASTAFLSLPSSGSPGAELSGLLLLGLPSTCSGKMMLKASACSPHPQAGGTEGPARCGGCGKARSLSSEQHGPATCVCPSLH